MSISQIHQTDLKREETDHQTLAIFLKKSQVTSVIQEKKEEIQGRNQVSKESQPHEVGSK
jgi:hypothetical protein